jgi:hypothetical protein
MTQRADPKLVHNKPPCLIQPRQPRSPTRRRSHGSDFRKRIDIFPLA